MRALVHPKLDPKRRALLAERARLMKAAPTESELLLWRALKNRQVLGVHFCRQVPIAGRWIADFVAAEVRVAIEIDGGYHCQRRLADARRDAALERLGYRVVRIETELVRRALSAALALVREAVARALLPPLG
jgi:very-short-patch-repair endonuclease